MLQTSAGTSRYPWLYPDVTTFQLWQLEYTSDDSVKQLVSRVGAAYGKIDFLYINAGRQYVGESQNSFNGPRHLHSIPTAATFYKSADGEKEFVCSIEQSK